MYKEVRNKTNTYLKREGVKRNEVLRLFISTPLIVGRK